MTDEKSQIFSPIFPVSRAYRVLEDVYIIHNNSIILDRDGNVIFDANNEQFFWSYHFASLDGRVKKVVSLADVTPEDTAVIQQELKDSAAEVDLSKSVRLSPNVDYVYFCHPFSWHAYGHIWDSFQRLYQVKDVGKRTPVVITSDFRRISNFLEHLNYWGYQSQRVFTFSAVYESVFVPRLVLGELMASPGECSNEAIRWMVQRYLLENDKIDKDLRIPGIYLDRNTVRAGRGVTNNQEVREYLESKGYAIVSGGESLSEIIQLFYSAEKVIGAHGAAFTNTVFCNEQAKIYEFVPRNRAILFFKLRWRLGDHYEQILVDSDETYNVEIDMNFLKEIA